ncbi:MAG: hypothetical protein IJ553_02110 [Alloprevotella sp.]|nr:hypothetical protein [Alloprevotella sp.]
MDENLTDIAQLIESGATTEAIDRLNGLFAGHPCPAQLHYLKGKALMKQSAWGEAISQFRQARMLEPDGPAAEAENMLLDIMDFYNKDMYNQ